MTRKASLLAAAFAAAGTLALAAPASAATWTPVQGYKNYDTCVTVGSSMIIKYNYKEYDCRWDSPYWMLWIRK